MSAIRPERRTRILAMIHQGLPDEKIANIEGITVQRVRGVRQSAPPVPPTPADDLHPILATGGRYAALAAYAAENGLTSTGALQEYHRLRAAKRKAR